MDSGNSDSFQSSNGGDEDYNSLGGGDTISATWPAAGLIYNPPPEPIIPNYQNLQNNMLPINKKNNNLDNMVWSKTLRSDPNQLFTFQTSNLPPSSSSFQEIMNTNSRTSSLPLSEHHALPSSVQNPNPKKRSRASRRAPTTVLTTDTTNFRAMVQEFTGIPTQPFTSTSSYSSFFPKNGRLDNIFGNYSISTKVQPILPPNSSSMFCNVDNSFQSSNLFTMQNPILASLLQSTAPKQGISYNHSIFGAKTNYGSMENQSSNGVLDEFGSLDGGLGALPGLVSADPERWGGGSGGANGGRECDDFSRNDGSGKRLKRMMEDGATNEGMMETWIYSSIE